jgi:hypothetical protein
VGTSWLFSLLVVDGKSLFVSLIAVGCILAFRMACIWGYVGRVSLLVMMDHAQFLLWDALVLYNTSKKAVQITRVV